MISSCIGEISPNLCHSCQHSSQPPDAPPQRLNELYPGKKGLQDDIGFKFEENSHIPQLQPPSWMADTKYDVLTLHADLSEADVYFNERVEAEWTKLIMLQLQSHVQLEKNNIQLLLARNQVMEAQYDREYQELTVELEAVKSDIMQYEDYISSKYYSFNNETWEYLKNVGRNELRTRKQVYLQQKMHLKQKSIRCWEEMKIYHQIMTYLNEEEIKRQQRMAEYSTNMLHRRKFGKHLLQNVLNRVTEEQKEIETRKCLVLNEMKASGPLQQNSAHCILKAEKLGCTFDFMLKHRVYSCGNVQAYNDLVDIFEKRLPSPETPQSIYCMQTLLISALENYMARLDQEMVFYLKKLKHTVSTENEGQKRLEMDDICSPVPPGFSDSKEAPENTPLDLSALPGSADHNHEDIYLEFPMNKVPEVEAVNSEEMKKIYSSQPVLQISSVFREQPDDSDIQNTCSVALKKTTESNQTEERKQDKPLKEKAKKLGFMQKEYDAHKLRKMKPTAERRAKMAGLKKDTSLAELLEKKLTTHITNTGLELCEIRKENETLRNKLDTILSTLEMKNDNNEQLDNKEKKLLDEGDQFTTQDDRIGLQLPSLENIYHGGKGAWITQGENRAVSSGNKEKAELQHLSQDCMVTGVKEENIPAQKYKTEWQLHSDGVASTSRTEIKEDFMAHENLGLQSHTAQVVVIGGKDADANKKETPEKITLHGVKVGLQISLDEDFSLEDETEDHAARKRNKVLIQKLSLLLDCIKDDRPISKHFVRHIKRIIKVNKSVSPPLMKLIDMITARSQQLVTLHHGTTKLAIKDEEFGQDSGAEKLEDLEISSDTTDSDDYSSSSTDSECSPSESSSSDFCWPEDKVHL